MPRLTYAVEYNASKMSFSMFVAGVRQTMRRLEESSIVEVGVVDAMRNVHRPPNIPSTPPPFVVVVLAPFLPPPMGPRCGLLVFHPPLFRFSPVFSSTS